MAAPVTVIVGGGGLIGRACVRALAARGHACVSLDVARPRGAGGDAVYVRCDVTSERSVRAAVERVGRRFGRLDNVVHSPNARPARFAAELARYDLAAWRRVLDVHVTGAMLMSRAVLPLMARRRAGSIVFVGSMYGVVAPTFALYGPGRPAPPLVYTAAKAALIGMAKWIAARYGRVGIRCNVVSPGGVDEAAWPGGGFKRRYLATVPQGRAVGVDDVARAIAYALEAEHLNGHNLVLDGGWTSI